MANKKSKEENSENGQVESSRGRRAKSDFPKNTFEEAFKVAKSLYDKNGAQPLPPIETASAIGISPGSSDFRVLLSSSIKYGLTSGSYNQEKISIDNLALTILEPKSDEEQKAATLESILKPQTFKSIYEYYKGKKIPEDKFLQNTVIREFEVPRDQAEKCVSIFIANMEHIGLLKKLPSGVWLSTEASTIVLKKSDDTVQNNETDLPKPDLPYQDEKPEQVKPTPPNKSSAIFIGHGKNHIPLEQLKRILDQYKIPYKVAIQEANKFRPISQKVAETMQECSAAILIFTCDEELKDNDGNTIWRPSENVIYELGAASVLYGGKIIIFKEDNVTFPSNFKDIGYISFPKDSVSSKTNELFSELISFGLIKVTVGM